MSAIIGGSVTYGRTTKPADYESKKAEVTLNFGIEQETPAEDRNLFILSVGNMAIHHCNRMLGINEPPAVYEPVPAVETAKRTRGPNKPKEVVIEDPFGGGPSLVPAADTGADAASTTTSAGGFGEQTAEVVQPEEFVASGEAVAITDVDLMTALNKKAAELGGAKEINVLLGQYIAKGANPREIPQEKRPEFIEKIHGLKAN